MEFFFTLIEDFELLLKIYSLSDDLTAVLNSPLVTVAWAGLFFAEVYEHSFLF